MPKPFEEENAVFASVKFMGKKQAFLSQNEKTAQGKSTRHLNIIISDPDEEQNYLWFRQPFFMKKSGTQNPSDHPSSKTRS
jgi:hypothetical protein